MVWSTPPINSKVKLSNKNYQKFDLYGFMCFSIFPKNGNPYYVAFKTQIEFERYISKHRNDISSYVFFNKISVALPFPVVV